MKALTTIFIMLSLMLSVITADAKEPKAEGPAISFEKTSHDFGNIKEEDGKAACEFKFTNTGTAPLVIVSAVAGCGCTKPTFDDAPIAPGQSSSIRVKYNPAGRPGEFNKTITVQTNAPKNKKVILKIKGCVIPESKDKK